MLKVKDAPVSSWSSVSVVKASLVLVCILVSSPSDIFFCRLSSSSFEPCVLPDIKFKFETVGDNYSMSLFEIS